jgi:hypothetical protein
MRRRVLIIVAAAALLGVPSMPSQARAGTGPDIQVSVTSWPATVSLDSGRVYYAVGAANVGTTKFKSVVLSSSLPSGSSLDAAESDPCWSAAGSTLTCSAGALAVGATTSRPLVIVVSSPGSVTTTVTATTNPKDSTGNAGSATTGVVAAGGTNSGGFLLQSESLSIDTVQGVHQFTMPTTASPKAATTLVSGPAGNFCGGPCASETVTLDFPFVVGPFVDAFNPGHVLITFDNLPVCRGLGGDCRVLHHTDADAPGGVPTPFCDGAQSGNEGFGAALVNGVVSAPCINEQSNRGATVTYDVLVLSNDPGFGAR